MRVQIQKLEKQLIESKSKHSMGKYPVPQNNNTPRILKIDRPEGPMRLGDQSIMTNYMNITNDEEPIPRILGDTVQMPF